jgi:hypothetical protein
MAGSTLEIRPVLVPSLVSVVAATSVMTSMMIIATLVAHASMVVIMLTAAHLTAGMLVILLLKSLCLLPESLVHLNGLRLCIWIECVCVGIELLLWMERAAGHLVSLAH